MIVVPLPYGYSFFNLSMDNKSVNDLWVICHLCVVFVIVISVCILNLLLVSWLSICLISADNKSVVNWLLILSPVCGFSIFNSFCNLPVDDQFVTTCLLIYHWSVDNNFVTGVGIYKRKILRQKERKHAFDQQKSKILEKKKGNTLSTKKKRKKTCFRPIKT